MVSLLSKTALFHGGLFTGARTPKGLQRILEANLKHGRQTKGKLGALPIT